MMIIRVSQGFLSVGSYARRVEAPTADAAWLLSRVLDEVYTGKTLSPDDARLELLAVQAEAAHANFEVEQDVITMALAAWAEIKRTKDTLKHLRYARAYGVEL